MTTRCILERPRITQADALGARKRWQEAKKREHSGDSISCKRKRERRADLQLVRHCDVKDTECTRRPCTVATCETIVCQTHGDGVLSPDAYDSDSDSSEYACLYDGEPAYRCQRVCKEDGCVAVVCAQHYASSTREARPCDRCCELNDIAQETGCAVDETGCDVGLCPRHFVQCTKICGEAYVSWKIMATLESRKHAKVPCVAKYCALSGTKTTMFVVLRLGFEGAHSPGCTKDLREDQAPPMRA